MPWDDKSKNKSGGSGKNPWGNRGPSNDDPNPWNANRKPGEPGQPDLDEIMRRVQDNLKSMLPGNWDPRMVAGLFAGAILVLWLASGFFVVQPGEHAVIQRFGEWSRSQEEPGLGYRLPYPVEKVTIVNVQEIRRLNIGFMEGTNRTGNAGRQDTPEESLMLTADRNIVDLDLVIQWNIKNAEHFLFEIEDQENTIKKVAESAIREVVGQTDMFPIITRDRDRVAQAARTILQGNLDQYDSGVNITQVLIERAEVHPEVQDAFQDVQSAKQDAEDVQNQAQSYREDILPKARGRAIELLQGAEAYKQSTVAKANGDAQRFISVYNSYLSGQDVTKERIYIETMEEVLRNAQKIILDKGAGEGVVPYLPLTDIKKGQ